MRGNYCRAESLRCRGAMTWAHDLVFVVSNFLVNRRGFRGRRRAVRFGFRWALRIVQMLIRNLGARTLGETETDVYLYYCRHTGIRARYASSEAPAARINTDFRLAA